MSILVKTSILFRKIMSSCVLLNFYILTMISYWHQIELMSRVYFNHLYFFISFIWKYLQNISHSLSYLPGTHITFENIIFISLQCNCFTARLPLLVIVEKSFFVPFDLFSLRRACRMLLHAWKRAAEKPGCGVCIAQQSQGMIMILAGSWMNSTIQ